jgi:chromosome segregation ATPase
MYNQTNASETQQTLTKQMNNMQLCKCIPGAAKSQTANSTSLMEELQCELVKLKEELKESVAAYDDLSSSSAAVEKELNDELEGLSKAHSLLKNEQADYKEKLTELAKRLSEQNSSVEGVRTELREAQASLAGTKEALVACETTCTQQSASLRASEALAERYKERYEEQLESAAVERCQLEDVKKELQELKQREKVNAVEDASAATKNSNNGMKEEMEKVKKEAAFTRQLLKVNKIANCLLKTYFFFFFCYSGIGSSNQQSIFFLFLNFRYRFVLLIAHH